MSRDARVVVMRTVVTVATAVLACVSLVTYGWLPGLMMAASAALQALALVGAVDRWKRG